MAFSRVADFPARPTKLEIIMRPFSQIVMLLCFILTLNAGHCVSGQESPRHSVVFQQGRQGYHSYRIPAIVQSKQGTLLAFCEGRKDSRSDAGDIDLVLRRSQDQGETWSELQVIWDDQGNTCGNPCPVVDQQSGTIWLLMTWNKGDEHEREILAGTTSSPRRVFVTHSSDDGRTWAEPTEISNSTRLDHWRWYATGPGNAIQLTHGDYQGRMVIPANHSDHRDESKHPFRSHVIFSDDGGQRWQLGGVHDEKTNESAVVELEGGAILQAMRSYHGGNQRAMSVSRDGGNSWEADYLDPTLETPVCQASMIRFSWAEPEDTHAKSRILFSSPKGGKRQKMHVWVSYDEGNSWPVTKQIYAGSAAYSNLVKLTEAQVGLLYERDNYSEIVFASFTLDWLESGQD